MNHFVYLKLAIQSIKKSYRISVPFLGGSILMCAILYSITSLSQNPALLDGDFFGSNIMATYLMLGSWIFMLFVLIFLFYLNSVWAKSRRQENGLLSILGMEKKHLLRIQFYQLLIFYLLTIGLGILLGIGLEKLVLLLVIRIFNMPSVLGFHLSMNAVATVAGWIGLCYIALLGYSWMNTLTVRPLENVHQKSAGEQKIKNRWVLALLGIVSLGAGYYLAITTKNPVQASMLFFVAVILVIIGTYLLFAFGSSVIIQALQKNKAFYYKPNHFITVSTLKYRLKQNSAALANIAILSTMVLVTLSTTVSLVAGVDNTSRLMYPNDALITVMMNDENPIPDAQAVYDDVLQTAEQTGYAPASPFYYKMGYKNFSTSSPTQPLETTVLDVEDWNRISGQSVNLNPGQAAVLNKEDLVGEVLNDSENPQAAPLEITQNITDIPDELRQPDMNPVLLIRFSDLPSTVPGLRYVIGFDSEKAAQITEDEQLLKMADEFNANLREGQLKENGSLRYDARNYEKTLMFTMYAGLLIIGIYLSILFVIAVVLIMYYKQLSEGIEDQGRFKILKNVGLEEKQVRKVINDQVLIMFFLPLAVAFIHILFAFPMISRMLIIMTPGSQNVFLIVTIATFVIFALIYLVIYKLTARTYYRLTWSQQNA